MEKHYKQISIWGHIIGILLMISAGISALFSILYLVAMIMSGSIFLGILLFLTILISGATAAYIGKIIFDSGSIAKKWLASPSEELQDLLISKYADFSYFNVIFMVVSIVCMTPLVFFIINEISKMPMSY